MDRYTQFENQEKSCFLCLGSAGKTCEFCLIPYCCDDHFKTHRDSNSGYCHPFRVLQRPDVSKCTARFKREISEFFNEHSFAL